MEGSFRDLANSGIDYAHLLRDGQENEEETDVSTNPDQKEVQLSSSIERAATPVEVSACHQKGNTFDNFSSKTAATLYNTGTILNVLLHNMYLNRIPCAMIDVRIVFLFKIIYFKQLGARCETWLSPRKDLGFM